MFLRIKVIIFKQGRLKALLLFSVSNLHTGFLKQLGSIFGYVAVYSFGTFSVISVSFLSPKLTGAGWRSGIYTKFKRDSFIY